MKKFLAVILALAIPLTVAACKGAVDTSADGVQITSPDGTPITNPDGTPATVPAVAVTDFDGQLITNSDGTKITRPLQIPITDKDGELVTNADGTPVTGVPTQPIPSKIPTDPIISDNEPVPNGDIDIKLPYDCEEAGLQIVAINRYDGFFAEDGTNDETKGSIALTVKNISGQYIDIGTILLTVNGKDDALFQFTYVAPNETIVLQEKNNMKYRSGDTFTYKTAATTFKKDITSGWYTGADILKIYPESGRGTNVVIANISGKDLKGGYIYYKQKHDGVIQGGITYRIAVNDLVAGETCHLTAWHFNEESVIVDVDLGK